MKTLYTTLVLGLLFLAIIPAVFATSVGTGTNPNIQTEQFVPRVFMCDHRIVTDDNTEPGRISNGGQKLVERINNYAFEGEQINWTVLVMDKNGVDKISDVFVTIGDSQDGGSSPPTIVLVNKSISTCGSFPLQPTDFVKNITLPKFNSSLGTLLSAAIVLKSNMTSDIFLEDSSTGGSYAIFINGSIVANFDGINATTILNFLQNATLPPLGNVSFNNISGAGVWDINRP